MKCGVVILNYNNYELTTKLVEQCIKITRFDEIVLVDNNSNDNFDENIKEWNSSRVKYIKNSENGGYAKGNNIGLKYLKDNDFKIAFISNPDVWFEEETIENIYNFLINNQNYGVCACQRYLHKDQKTRQFWWVPTFKDTLKDSFYFMRRYSYRKSQERSYEITNKYQNNDVIDVEVVGGAFLGCNLDIIEKADYLDERTFLWYEENILSFKLKTNNYKVGYLPNVVYHHNHVKKSHGNNKISYYLASKKVYCYNYLKIGFFKKVLLSVSDFIGNIEEHIICMVFK